MEEAAAVRRAAIASVDDVEPVRLREDLRAVIDGGSMVPGVLTVLTARAGGTDADGAEAPGDGAPVPEGVAERAAGVQLIYDGLRLTRRLSQEEPWRDGDRQTADMSVLAADVLVARGFYLLARTEAAGAAVEVVRAFGRDQTDRRTENRPELDANLEADVLELAVVAGAATAGTEALPELRALAADLADRYDDEFPPAATLAERDVGKQIAQSVGAYADH